MTEDEFWASTPAEIERRQWVHWKQRQEHSEDLRTLAWMIATLSRSKRVPSLAVFTARPTVPTPDELQVSDTDHERLVREMGG